MKADQAQQDAPEQTADKKDDPTPLGSMLFGPNHPQMKSIQYLNDLSAQGSGLLTPQGFHEKQIKNTLDLLKLQPSGENALRKQLSHMSSIQRLPHKHSVKSLNPKKQSARKARP